MTTIFISHTKENAECADQMRTGLEAQGYIVWREPGYSDPQSASYPSMIEQAIVGSVAVVLVWSSSAAQTEWIERQILFAQRLKKPIFPVMLDGTSLPTTLVAVSPVTAQAPCTDVVALLRAQPTFPPVQSSEPLSKLAELAAHEYIRERKAAIDVAAEMLKRNEQREAVLAILEYLARNDLMMGMREKAEQVLVEATTKQAGSPLPLLRPGDSRHIFGVRCKNGHVSYFDKRVVCTAYKEFPRALRTSAGKELDELHFTCDTCGVEVVAREDCEGYK